MKAEQPDELASVRTDRAVLSSLSVDTVALQSTLGAGAARQVRGHADRSDPAFELPRRPRESSSTSRGMETDREHRIHTRPNEGLWGIRSEWQADKTPAYSSS